MVRLLTQKYIRDCQLGFFHGASIPNGKRGQKKLHLVEALLKSHQGGLADKGPPLNESGLVGYACCFLSMLV